MRYRRNSDQKFRTITQNLLKDSDPDAFSRYVRECQRLGIQPEVCQCRKVATIWCENCGTPYCAACRIKCSGEVGGEACLATLCCAQSCSGCRRTVCSDAECSMAFELVQCYHCEKYICDDEDCRTECSKCEEYFCVQDFCSNQCSRCQTANCDKCAITCEHCGEEVCPQDGCRCCYPDCEVCFDCCESDDSCSECNALMCENHVRRCYNSNCENPVCPEHSTACSYYERSRRCDSVACNACELLECSVCDETEGCDKHFTECDSCGQSACPNCLFTCPVCQLEYCKSEDCLEACSHCETEICEGCVKEHLENCQYAQEIKEPSSSWIPKVGDRVKHSQSGLLGSVIKVNARSSGLKVIVEWDDETASMYDLGQIGPAKRKFY